MAREVVIAGKNNIAVDALLYLIQKYGDYNYSVVSTKDDSGIDTWQKSLLGVAQDYNIPVITLDQAQSSASIFLSLEFDQIIRPDLFATNELYNFHFSLLPKYRGVYTAVWPIMNNEDYSGVTLHRIDNGVDTGDIIAQKEILIERYDSSLDLYLKCISVAGSLFIEHIDDLLAGNIDSSPQSSGDSVYYDRASIDFTNLSIDFTWSSKRIIRYLRAVNFRPYQIYQINKKNVVKAVALKTKAMLKPGEVISENTEYIDFSTSDYDVRFYYDRFHLSLKGCISNDRRIVSYYANNIVNINDRDYGMMTLLMHAVDNACIDVLDYLVNNGANLNIYDGKSRSVRHFLDKHPSNIKNEILSVLKEARDYNFILLSNA